MVGKKFLPPFPSLYSSDLYMCKHVPGHVSLSTISRQLESVKSGKYFTSAECEKCSKKGGEIWLCLSCGFRGCGRLDNRHMVSHYEKSAHCVSMNLRTTMIWCYKCDDEVTDDVDDVRDLVKKTIDRLSGVKDRPDTRKSVTKGCRGIVNIGNTCFLAASMQCLSHTPPFQKLLRHCPPFLESQSGQQKLIKAIRDFFIDQWGDPWEEGDTKRPANPINPDDILTSVQRINSLFHGYQQHDSQEFLRFLLCTVHEEIRRRVKPSEVKILSTIITSPVLSSAASPNKKEGSSGGDKTPDSSPTVFTSMISDVFMGQTCSTVTCLECKKESKCIEDFYDLSLPIPNEPTISKKNISEEQQHSSSSWFMSKARSLFGFSSGDLPVSLADCLSQYTRTEKLCDSNSYSCEHCKRKTESLKTITIHKLPEILVLHLKRFKHDGGYYGGSKISKTVLFPVASDFDMSPFVAQPGISTKYRLCGFVVHMGSLSGGHYIAYCRHKSTGQWFCFDDSRVTPVVDLSVIESAEPYVMFFHKNAEKTTVRERKTLKTDPVICGAQSLPSLYLPRRWVCSVKTMATIPPITNTDLVCPHFLPATMSAEIARMQFQAVSAEFAQRALNRYGVLGLTSDLLGIEKCGKCEEWIKGYNHRLTVEHKLVTSLDTKGIEAGEVWFYIDSAWINAWRAYLKQGAIVDRNRACNPGPIDNTLLDKKMKEGKVKMTVDFVAVNQKVWSVFVHFHGSSGIAITRDSLDPNSNGGSEIGLAGDTALPLVSLGMDPDSIERIQLLKLSGI